MSKVQMGRWSEEEHLLGYDKYNSNMYSNNQGDLSGSSSDKDGHHKHIRMKKTQKYLVESCYHRIECTAATTALNALQLLFWSHLCGEDP